MNAVISQFDLVTGYGRGLDALWDGLLSGKTSIRASDRFAGHKFVSNQIAMVPGLEVAPGESRAMAMLKPLLEPLAGKLDPQTPLILATTVGEIEYVEQAILNGSADSAADARPQVLLARIKKLLALRGPAMVVSSACASSATALSRAASMILGGAAPAVLVVTCDSVSEFVYSGFSTLLSLCETPARPFDAHRAGLSLGEAAAWAMVTSSEAPQTNDDAIAILGWGSSTDAVHMTAPDRAARGLSRAIVKACEMAVRDAGEIAFVAAHGTATVYSDAMELLAFRSQLHQPVPVFSVKGGTGHTLAAAGLVQILVAGRALARGVVPPTVGLSVPDADAAGWASNAAVDIQAESVALSTNSGFGGVNTAVILGTTTEGRTNSQFLVGCASRTVSPPSRRIVGVKTENDPRDTGVPPAQGAQSVGNPALVKSKTTYELPGLSTHRAPGTGGTPVSRGTCSPAPSTADSGSSTGSDLVRDADPTEIPVGVPAIIGRITEGADENHPRNTGVPPVQGALSVGSPALVKSKITYELPEQLTHRKPGTGETPVSRETCLRAISWFCVADCGIFLPSITAWRKPSPSINTTEQMLALIGRPVKYFGRMTPETRTSLVAASIAMKAAGWNDISGGEIGLLAAGQEGCLAADKEYFRDYVVAGRSMGRGNLFIYTLPTSTLGEVAIALSLTGPTIHLQDDAKPLPALIDHARQLLTDGEASGMLLLWSDPTAAVCLAIGPGENDDDFVIFNEDQRPLQLAQTLSAMVRQA